MRHSRGKVRTLVLGSSASGSFDCVSRKCATHFAQDDKVCWLGGGWVGIKTISTREVYRNRWTSVREDVIERANGQRGIYGVIDKDPACIIIPLESTPEGDFVYLVEQFRYTVLGRYMEFPQGGWEEADIVPEELARGELKEETGITAAKLTHLTDLQIAYGVMNQKHHVFLAEGLTRGETDPDPEETDLALHRYSVRDFETMLLDGTIVDNCTAAAWGVYRVWKERQGLGNSEQMTMP